MKNFRFSLLLFILLGLMPPAALAQSAPPFELHWRGRKVSLPTAAQQELQELALRLLKSSNDNSGATGFRSGFTFTDVQRNYRETIAGSYLLVTFSTPQRIHTIGGDVTVSELVLGLNRPGGAGPLFTIEPSAPLVAQGQYAGELCVEILTTIKRLTNDP
jgi:hypothetical protein